jgi:hypothetical protein
MHVHVNITNTIHFNQDRPTLTANTANINENNLVTIENNVAQHNEQDEQNDNDDMESQNDPSTDSDESELTYFTSPSSQNNDNAIND